MKKVCVFGAGAVGGHLVARIGHAKRVELSVVVRGVHKDAMLRNGIRLDTPDGSITARPAHVTDQPHTLPEQDLIFVTVKAMAQPAIAGDVKRLLRTGGDVVFVANGLPWWWKHATAKPAPLPLLDPQGVLWRELTPRQVLGCVVYSANEVVAPGVVRHLGNNRWVLGEPDATLSPRLQATVDLLCRCGVNAEASTDLRTEIWGKLMRNASLNSLCALTRLPVDGLAEDPALLALADALVEDIIAIAASQGCDISHYREGALKQLRCGGAEGKAASVKGLCPSMLQDVLAGRALEVEAILGQPYALALEAGLACPALSHVLPLVRGLNRSQSKQP